MRLIALASLLLLAANVARADQTSPGTDPGTCEALRTINATSNQIWVTVYDLGHTTHLDYGWVAPCSVRVWRAGSYSCGSYYHVRAEVKPYDVSKDNVFDTQVETNPQVENYGSWVVTLRRNGSSNNYYWEHGNTASCTPTGVTACCKDYVPPQGDPYVSKPEPRAPANVDVTFDNATKTYAKVTVYLPGYKAPRTGSVLDGTDDTQPDILKVDCVPPETKKTWNLYGAFEYRFRAEPHLKSCDGAEKLLTQGNKASTTGTTAGIRLVRDEKTRGVMLVAPTPTK
jgi:hypothetical protein